MVTPQNIRSLAFECFNIALVILKQMAYHTMSVSRKKVFMLVRTWALSFITHYNYTVKQSVVSDGTSTGKCKPNIEKGNSYSAYNNIII